MSKLSLREYLTFITSTRWPIFMWRMEYILGTWNCHYRWITTQIVFCGGLLLTFRIFLTSLAIHYRLLDLAYFISNKFISDTLGEALFDKYLLLCLSFILVALALVHNEVYASNPKSRKSWETSYDMTNRNIQQFWTHNRDTLKEPFQGLTTTKIHKVPGKIGRGLLAIFSMFRNNRFTFGKDKLQYIHHCKDETRIRMLAVFVLSELMYNILVAICREYKRIDMFIF